MPTFLKNTKSPPWITCSVLAVILHAVSFSLPGVNFEFTFADASRFFATGTPSSLELYFHYEANTLGIPFLIHVISTLGMTAEHAARLISLAGIPLLAYAVTQINRALKNPLNDYLLLLIVLLNPLVFVFSGRGTADFFPAALALFGATYPLNHRTAMGYLLSGVFMGMAGVLKYHALLLSSLASLLVLFCASGTSARQRAKYLVTFYIPSILPLACYLIYMHHSFGFWIVPATFQKMVGMNSNHFGSTLISYCGYLMLLMLPFSASTLPEAKHFALTLTLAGAYVSCFLAGYWLLPNNGEMDLGPLNGIVTQRVLSGLFAVLFFHLAIQMLGRVRESRRLETAPINHTLISIAVSLAIALIALSCTRPAQRYLLFLLPLSVFMIPAKQFKNVRLNAIWFLAVLTLNGYLLLNQYFTGTAAREMASYITSHSLSEGTDLGAIKRHVGDLEFLNQKTPQSSYIVVSGPATTSVHTTTIGHPPFLGKTYSLIPVMQTQQENGADSE